MLHWEIIFNQQSRIPPLVACLNRLAGGRHQCSPREYSVICCCSFSIVNARVSGLAAAIGFLSEQLAH